MSEILVSLFILSFSPSHLRFACWVEVVGVSRVLEYVHGVFVNNRVVRVARLDYDYEGSRQALVVLLLDFIFLAEEFYNS